MAEIVIDEHSPRWMRELSRFVSIKNLIFLHGNVYDLVSFPVRKSESEPPRWTETDLAGFLCRFLLNQGYELIGQVDPVEDLRFLTPEMAELFRKLEMGEDLSAPHTETAGESSQKSAAANPADYGGPTVRTPTGERSEPTAGAPANLDRVVRRMALGLANTKVPCAFVVNFASRLLSAPDRLGREDRIPMTRLLKAVLNTREIAREDGRWNNLVILICEKLNDLPTFLYLNNSRSRSIHVELPDREERARYIRRCWRYFHGVRGNEGEPSAEVVRDFVDHCDGLTNFEMRSLVSLSHRFRIPLIHPASGGSNVRRLTDMYKYGVTESEWEKIDAERLREAPEFLRKRIKGQDAAVEKVLDIIRRASIGIAAGEQGKANRPRGVLFFAGPTGVGKTETAKAMAELLFGREDRLIRFDMSEFSAPHSDQRLLGAPPGYVGYEEGGQLTNAVQQNPFSVLLFDEIEKAHPSIFDKFLQILDDGRLTDGRGDTVYFSECIIIFTSNLGTVTRNEEDGSTRQLVTPDMPYSRMREIVLAEIARHFNFELKRPEILNRFGDNFVVFNFIRPPYDEQIVDMLVGRLDRSLRESRQISLRLGTEARSALIAFARTHLHHGGRGIRNAVDSALVNPLSRILFEMPRNNRGTLTVLTLKDNGPEAPIRFELETRLDDSAENASA